MTRVFFFYRHFYLRLRKVSFAVISKSGVGQLDILLLDTSYKVN